MKTIKRMFLVAGVLTFPVTVIQGKDKPQVSIGGLGLGYTSDWIFKLAETTEKVDLLEINFNSFKETVPNKGIFSPDTTGLKLKKVTPPEVDENMEKRPNG
jgi:hypothetical protein